jgi:hypothetical protein
MKTFIQKLTFFSIASFILWSCKKDEVRAVLGNGVASQLSSSVSTLVLDDTKKPDVAVEYSFTDADYGAQVALSYKLQLDTAGNDFATSRSYDMGTNRSKSFTHEELNTILIALGFEPLQAGTLEARIVATITGSSLAPLISAVNNLSVTPYSVVLPPKYPVPDNLFIVGDATPGGWNNPVPDPSQKLAKISDTKFAITIFLTGGKNYLFLPVNGSWSQKYALDGSKSDPQYQNGGPFKPNAGDDFPSPAADGLYNVIVDFVTGEYSVSPAVNAAPENLFIVGNATPGGWNNPVPVPSQQFTRTTSMTYEVELTMSGGDTYYLFLPENGSWSQKYALDGSKADPQYRTGGPIKVNAGDDFPGPLEAGDYKIEVDLFNLVYKVTKKN